VEGGGFSEGGEAEGSFALPRVNSSCFLRGARAWMRGPLAASRAVGERSSLTGIPYYRLLGLSETENAAALMGSHAAGARCEGGRHRLIRGRLCNECHDVTRQF
jgi:hypothetical protein